MIERMSFEVFGYVFSVGHVTLGTGDGMAGLPKHESGLVQARKGARSSL